MISNKRILLAGGTGSLGKVLVERILSRSEGKPAKVIVLSRDEAKQHNMRVEYQQKRNVTDDIIYKDFEQVLEFRIGDVRDYHTVCSALNNVDIVIYAAALKQVPICEYFPYEAVRTNITGAENVVRAVSEHNLPVKTVVGVSTDKACKPVNVMGMTKSIQERIFINGNLSCPNTRFICVRYGNVLASRGSVIPLFHEQIRNGGPVTITTPDMTRFLLSLESAVDTIFAALENAFRGETFIPKIPAARITEVAAALIGERNIEIRNIGIRPGEKIHESLVSEEEGWRTYDRGDYYVIQPILPELRAKIDKTSYEYLNKEYSSADNVFSFEEIKQLLEHHNLMLDQEPLMEGELLR
jgi:UDP-glucose 4-epimerase